MSHYCYIIFNKKLDRYYTGESIDPIFRLSQHNSGFFSHSFNSKSSDWTLFLQIPCQDIVQARMVELFIKNQKSRKFIERLKQDPSIIEDILKRFS